MQTDLRVILDFVPNHTSDESDWFKKSEDPNPQTAEDRYFRDFYVWHDGHPTRTINETNGVSKPAPPNNWVRYCYMEVCCLCRPECVAVLVESLVKCRLAIWLPKSNSIYRKFPVKIPMRRHRRFFTHESHCTSCIIKFSELRDRNKTERVQYLSECRNLVNSYETDFHRTNEYICMPMEVSYSS